MMAVISTGATSTSACNVTYAMTLPIVSVRPFVSLAVTVSGEPSRKRKQECSD